MSRRPLGLQGWLVAALLAVGTAASLAVLLVVLPTLESSVRTDRAKREALELRGEVQALATDAQLVDPVTQADVDDLAVRVRASTGAEVRVEYRTRDLFAPRVLHAELPSRGAEYIDRFTPVSIGSQGELGDGSAVFATVPLADLDGIRGAIVAVRGLTGVAPEIAIVRRRVIIAMIVVLGLAALAGIALARVIGGRIQRLASTAATLAAGDLSARAPRVAPEELATLGESLNGMAGRLESLVAEITDERDRDRALVASLAEGVVVVGPDDAVAVANDAAGRLLGLRERADAIRLDDLPAPVAGAVRAVREPGAPAVERRLVSLPGGAELEVHASSVGAAGAGTVLTLRDVTEQRRLERARRDLVANVSHELKTPIAALKGFLELLEGDVGERHRREFLASMSQETARLERLVEEQLQLARLDAGALPLEREEVDLGALAAEVVAPRAPLAEREGVALGVVLTEDGPAVVDADPARIEQILLILLDNALRHTPAGGRVDVVVGADGAAAQVAVRDTGEGIPDADRPFVFDRFYRGDASREGRSAGLGLAIARGLAHAHGGAIDLESRVGEGSTFTLRLPLAAAGRPDAPGPAAPAPDAAAPPSR